MLVIYLYFEIENMSLFGMAYALINLVLFSNHPIVDKKQPSELRLSTLM